MRDARLTNFAKVNRQLQSEPETRLWLELRANRFADTKFRRQKVIGSYIVDFACRAPMLVIEIDGDTHAHQEAYDEQRSLYLQDQGYRVIRFTNLDVMRNLAGVLETIAVALATPPLPTLSPEGERAKAPSPLQGRGSGRGE